MKYANFIKGNEGFQYSINIQYDLMNLSKVKGYIPTRKSVEILKDYLLNTIIDNRDKSTVLIGPYGKGKSHLILVLIELMYRSKNVKELKNLIDRISLVDEDCAELAKQVLNDKKYLPIIVNFNSGDLNQAFLIALNNALRNEGIENILPNTYFDVAVEVLDGWRQYKGTIEVVKSIINEKYKISLDTFIRKLKSFDINSYKLFKEIFLEVTSGIEFNPLINADVVKLYEETNYLLKEEFGFDGIVIVFDEFSKFIESNSDLNSAINLKILQDFAEISNRSNNPQIHLICITHKTLNEYISKIPQEKIDAWRAIEGRFKEKFFNVSSYQNYELISNAIIKNQAKVEEVLEEKNILNNKKILNANTIFKYNDEQFIKDIVKGCFPLNPYTTYALPIISEKVAQNERTLFTYLSKDEPNSLIELVNNESIDFELVTLDKLYDYFEPLFKKETFNESVHDIWIKTDTALKIVYSDEEKRVIKTLGLIYIINDFTSLPPTEETISNILEIDKYKISNIVKNLRDLNIIVLRKSNETLDFIPLSSVNINEKISNTVNTKFKSINIANVCNELVKLKYVLAKRYNDKYKMTRFFKRTFMSLNQVEAYSDGDRILKEYNTDGLIIDFIYEDKDDIKYLIEWSERINDNRIVLVIPRDENKIKNDLLEYKAINYLKKDDKFLQEDKAIESQLDILFDDIKEKIDNYLEKTYDIELTNSKVKINGKIYNEIKAYRFSELISEICEENFSKTPIINNEMINKQEISAPIKKARNQIVTMILENKYYEFDYSRNSVDCTIFRSTIVNKGLLKKTDIVKADIKNLLSIIKSFILDSTNKEKSFQDLYLELLSNKNKIGIRKGILPIYLAFVLREYNEEAIIYFVNGRSKKELVLDNTVIENINLNPQNYSIKLEKGTLEKEIFLDNLFRLFNEYIKNKSNNRYVDILSGMKAWVQSLSLYAQNHKIDITTNNKLPNEIIKLRNELIKYEINYRSFIFNNLFKCLHAISYNECIEKLTSIKDYLDNYDRNVKIYLINKTNRIINKNYKGSLLGNLNVWYKSLDNEKKMHLYDADTNEFLNIIQKNYTNENELIDRLAYIFTGLSIEDWNDNTFDIYIERVNISKRDVEEYSSINGSDEDKVKIIFESKDNNLIEKTFDKVEVSPLGSTLLNSIEEIIDEYSSSVDDNEKRNILMNILSKYI